jgi:hypothetical protein
MGGTMPEDNNSENKEEIKTLMLEASKLGFEVGYLGQVEEFGWVKNRFKIIELHADNLGILEEIRKKYELSKDLGIKRRSQTAHSNGEDKAEKTPILELEQMPNTMHVKSPGEKRNGFDGASRISPEEGISAVVNVLKVSENSHWVTRQLDLAFSGIADLHDMLGRISQDGTPEAILTEGLEKLKLTGWITDYSIEEVNAGLKTAKVSAISAIPNQYGVSTIPVCISISLALESIGARAFKAPVQAIEKRCMCQGDEKCGFMISPR